MLNKMPLKIRLTIITAAILVVVCIIISMLTLFNAEQAMFRPIRGFQSEYFMDEGASRNGRPNVQDFGLLLDNSREKFRVSVILTMFGLIAIGSYAMYFFASKALKPVTDLSDEIQLINEYSLNKRLEVNQSDDEISSLTKSFNGMLEKLESAFNSQKRFSQNAAHELKTPLTSIMTNIEVLEMDKKPSKQEYKEVVDITKSSTERLIQLVDSLLKVNNKGRHVNEEIDVSEMFDEILIDLNTMIEKRKIEIELIGNTTLYADVSLLERAFTNLISNAIRYNNEGGKVKISINENNIIISDNGIGIDKDKINDIFEPFYCVDNSRSKSLGGTGLGLSIVKEIFNQYDLVYNVESELDKGTTININIEPLKCK